MKSICSIFYLLACISFTWGAEQKPTAKDVVLKVLDKPLPSEETAKASFLWDNFANKPDEQKFNSYTTNRLSRPSDTHRAFFHMRIASRNGSA